MLDVIKPYMLAIKIGLLAIAAVTLVAVGYNLNHEGDRVQAAWDHANAVAISARAKRVETVRKAESDLQAAANEDRRNNEKARQALADRVAQLARELRNRPERPAAPGQPDVPAGTPGPGPASACTGAGLYRDDGVFLAGFAGMCQDIRNQRDDYLRKYERAQQRLRSLGQEP